MISSISTVIIFRHIHLEQSYNLTELKKSNVRAHDELPPRPSYMGACEISRVNKDPTKESSLSSHNSKFQLFPDPDRRTRHHSNENITVLKKTAGNFGRVEKIEKLPEIGYKASKEMINVKQKSYHDNHAFSVECRHCNFQNSYFANVCEKCEYPLHGTNRKRSRKEESGENFFSKHRIISNFSQRYPSITPSLHTRLGRRPADWHLQVANHTVGR